jgi:Tol biopolymer transport system component
MVSRIRALAVLATAAVASCSAAGNLDAIDSRLYANPQRVAILGYDGDAMEPFLSRDGRYLLFNNLNDPSVNTNLHFAERVDDLTFRYRGELQGTNTVALEGVPTMDRRNTIYFVSPRSYELTLSTIYRGTFNDGAVSGVELVPGVSRREPRIVNFDVDVSPDGEKLYFVDGYFGKSGVETADIVVAERHGAAFVRSANSAELLKSVNTKALEYAPCISADELTLLFTRARRGLNGSVSIFVSQRMSLTEPFGPAARLVALDGFVEGPTLSPDERSIYYHKREGDKFVIYRARKSAETS